MKTSIEERHVRFQEYRMRVNAQSILPGSSTLIAGQVPELDFEQFESFWSNVSENRTRRAVWKVRLDSGGFDFETRVIENELSRLPLLKIKKHAA